jgi:hypothetical protein
MQRSGLLRTQRRSYLCREYVLQRFLFESSKRFERMPRFPAFATTYFPSFFVSCWPVVQRSSAAHRRLERFHQYTSPGQTGQIVTICLKLIPRLLLISNATFERFIQTNIKTRSGIGDFAAPFYAVSAASADLILFFLVSYLPACGRFGSLPS